MIAVGGLALTVTLNMVYVNFISVIEWSSILSYVVSKIKALSKLLWALAAQRKDYIDR